MKHLKLYEQFRLILEATGKRCVLSDGKLDVDKFISDLGMKKQGVQYWIKLRKPLEKGQRLFNSRGKEPEDLEKFIS